MRRSKYGELLAEKRAQDVAVADFCTRAEKLGSGFRDVVESLCDVRKQALTRLKLITVGADEEKETKYVDALFTRFCSIHSAFFFFGGARALC